jgi:hypothetical protein
MPEPKPQLEPSLEDLRSKLASGKIVEAHNLTLKAALTIVIEQINSEESRQQK